MSEAEGLPGELPLTLRQGRGPGKFAAAGRPSWGRTPVLVVGLVLIGLVLAIPSILPATPDLGPDGSTGVVDFSYRAAGVSAPTGRKTEASKLWFHDGSWWGVLFRTERDAFTINRFDVAKSQWLDTGVAVDDRNDSQADMLWDGSHLYALSGGADPRSQKDAVILARMSYDAGAQMFRMDDGFPVPLTRTGAEVFTIARDDTGQLWLTLTNDRQVWIAHTTGDDRSWTEVEPLPVPEAAGIADDDISSIVAYDGHIGVMWSNQRLGAMFWASRATGGADSKWTVTAAVRGPALADDHVNLKALHDDPAGLVLAAIKTSRNDLPNAEPDDPLILVMVLQRDGTWTRHVANTVKDDATRPILFVDTDHRMLYVVASAPCCSGGTIYYKATALDDIDFESGRGTVLMRRGRTSALNNPSAAKQPITSESGLLVLAADDEVQLYMHAALPLSGPLVPKPTGPTTGAGGAAQGSGPQTSGGTWLDDSFETGNARAWSIETGPGAVAAVSPDAARTDRLGLRLAAGTGADGFAVARYALPAAQANLTVGLDFQLLEEGAADGNSPLLRLLAADGARLVNVYRQNQAGGRIWISVGDERTSTLGKVELLTWAHLEVWTLRTDTETTVSVALDGRLIGGTALPRYAAPAMIQIGNDRKGQTFAIVVDNVRVYR